MKNAYVVRELVSLSEGEKEFHTHYEYGTFRTYKAANECAIATRNPRCFPQKEQFFASSRTEKAFVNQSISMNVATLSRSGVVPKPLPRDFECNGDLSPI